MFYKICMGGAFLCFLTATTLLVAYVYDLDPVSPEKEYTLEKEAFDRNNDSWSREFPCFTEWCERRLEADARFREWLGRIGTEFSAEFAASCEMTVDQLKAWCHARGTTIGDYQRETEDYGGISGPIEDSETHRP